VQTVRAKYPTPLGAQHPLFLIEVCHATGAKLLQKDAGSHVTLPNGLNVSQDILMFLDQGVDILSDAEGAATASWQEKGTIAGNYIDVSGLSVPGGPPTPAPVPVPAPAPTVDLGPLLELIAKLDQRVARLEAASAPDLSAYAKRGAAVSVTGHVMTYGIRSSDATWEGTIK
jgi:hypothetical protein